jgi:hypothetical protein
VRLGHELVLPEVVNQDEKGVTANCPGILTPSSADKKQFTVIRSSDKVAATPLSLVITSHRDTETLSFNHRWIRIMQ